jgi:hypothetical protein
MILMVACLMAVMLSAAPALARHGADDPAGHNAGEDHHHHHGAHHR